MELQLIEMEVDQAFHNLLEWWGKLKGRDGGGTVKTEWRLVGNVGDPADYLENPWSHIPVYLMALLILITKCQILTNNSFLIALIE